MAIHKAAAAEIYPAEIGKFSGTDSKRQDTYFTNYRAEPGIIRLPIKKDMLEWCIQKSEELQISLLSTAQDITADSVKSPVLQWISQREWIMLPKRSETPLPDAVTAFTDAGKKSKRAAVTWMEDGVWHHHILSAMPGDSLQTLELAAVVWAVLRWHDQSLNVVADSLYVAGVLQRMLELKTPRILV